MLITFSLARDAYYRTGQDKRVSINPAWVVSVKETERNQVVTIHLTTGEAYDVVDFGNVVKVINEAQQKEASNA